jgi:threonine synthase
MIASELSAMYSIFCRDCGSSVRDDTYVSACPSCGGSLDFSYSSPLSLGDHSRCKSIWDFRDFLPLRPGSEIVSLGEGFTPLQRARLPRHAEIYLKNETLNPTGSQKDRALSVGVTKALEFGCDTLMLYSDGSTALASAAYAARVGLRNITLVPWGTPESRLLPLSLYNSILLEYEGESTAALDWVHRACQSLGIYETSTYRRANPYESEAPKTIAFEIVQQLGHVPDWVVVPVGGGGTLAGIWKGFADLETSGLTSQKPHMLGVLPEGYTMLETAVRNGVKTEHELRALTPRPAPPTLQVKLAMPFPPDGLEAIEAIRQSDGMFVFASDTQALEAQRKLAADAGIYAELSAAVAWVGVETILRWKETQACETIVAIITGSGFRETSVQAGQVKIEKISVASSSGFEVLERILEREV